jgi:hypothetical protein
MINSKFKFPHKFESNERLSSQVKNIVKDSNEKEDEQINLGAIDIS